MQRVMVGNFVSGGFDAGDEVIRDGMPGGRVRTIQEEGSLGVVLVEDVSRTCRGVKMGCGPSSKERATRGWRVGMR